MAKKNRKDNAEKNADQESGEIESGMADQVPAGQEADASDSGMADSASDDFSMDDLLDDVRKSLIEEEEQDRNSKPTWWGKRSKGAAKEHASEDVIAAPEPSDPIVDENKPDEYLGQIDELIDMLDSEPAPDMNVVEDVVAENRVEESVIEEPPVEPEPLPVDMDDLKKRAFSSRDAGSQVDISEVRSVAFDEGEDVFVEVEARQVDVRQDQLKAFENALRPYRQYIYILVAFLAVVVVAVVSVAMYTVYQRNRPPEVVETFDPNLPHPTGLVLPGGLNFNLGRGVIADGKWNPRGPEWLQGTEICRWVAIPWSTQLEAVVRTFTQKDTIDLVMNNGDKLTYAVYSIKELTFEEMQALDQNSPCLLLVLVKQDSDKRWVVTALP